MEQPTFADLKFENKKRKTRREMLLELMEEFIPLGLLPQETTPLESKQYGWLVTARE